MKAYKNKKRSNSIEKAEKRLTIGMIVKNEEKYLANCLDSLQTLLEQVDGELIIADTGSTDRTKEIALQRADLVFDFPWCDDFAAARNAVLNQSKGEWHFFIDADECLEEGIEEMVSFLNSPGRKKYNSASINIYTPLSVEGRLINATTFYAYRLFKAKGNSFYSPIHEVPIISEPVKKLPTTIKHYGYIYENHQQYEEKCIRNSRILKKKLEQNPDVLQVVCYCLESCANEEDREDYIERGKLIAQKHPNDPLCGSFCSHLMSYLVFKNEYEEAIQAGETYLNGKKKILAKDIDIIWKLGELYDLTKQQEKKAEAYQQFLSLRTKYDNNTLDKSELKYTMMYFIEEFWRAEAKAFLAEYHWNNHDYELAAEYLYQVNLSDLKMEPYNKLISFLFLAVQDTSDFSFIKWCYGQIRTFMKYEEEKEEAKKYILFENRLREFLLMNSNQLASFAQCFANCEPEWEEDAIVQYANLLILEKESAFKEKLQEYLQSICKWENVYEIIYCLAIKYGCLLPDHAIQVSNERMDAIWEKIFHLHMTFIQEFFQYCDLIDRMNVAQLNMLLRVFALLFDHFSTIEEKLKKTIIHNFIKVSAFFLKRIYKEEILCDTQISILPLLHQFGYWLEIAEKKREEGQAAAYIKSLKKATESTPQLKQVTEYLLVQFEEEQQKKDHNRQEFEDLAEKIRQTIDTLLINKKQEEAKIILKQYLTLCPDDISYTQLLKEIQ